MNDDQDAPIVGYIRYSIGTTDPRSWFKDLVRNEPEDKPMTMGRFVALMAVIGCALIGWLWIVVSVATLAFQWAARQ